MKKTQSYESNLPYHNRNFPKVAAGQFVREKLNSQLQDKNLGTIMWKDNLAYLKLQF